MLTRDEIRIREVEQEIDQYCAKFKLFTLPRQVALLHALKFFEDACRLPQLREKISLEHHDISMHDNLDALDFVVKWIYSLCKENEVAVDYTETSGKYYRYAMIAFTEALKYRVICAAYTSWSRGYTDAQLDVKKKKLRFTRKYDERTRLHAIDTLLYQRNKISFLDRIAYQVESIDSQLESAKEELLANTKLVDRRIIQYKITPLVWNSFQYLAELQVNDSFELPNEWEFTCFTIKELKLFWTALLTKAYIHNWICFNAGADGIGLDSVIIVMGVNELSDEIEKRTGLVKDKVLAILNYITYNPSIKNTDVAWQPLILLENGKLAIASNLIIHNNAERNIISLINKVEQATYSRLSSMKEAFMASELMQRLSSKYPHLLLAQKKNLPGRLPDMDFIIYDKHNKVLFIAELKWLLSVASAQETFARENDLRKGVSQASQIRDYVNKDITDCLIRVFGSSNLVVDEVFVCVISKHNTGSVAYNKDISVISEPTFHLLMDKYVGNLKGVVASIKNEEYYPRIEKDFKLLQRNFEYAGYRISTPGYQITGNDTKSIG